MRVILQYSVITPVHKKGDRLNADKFFPICELSCLCKFFKNAKNLKILFTFLRYVLLKVVGQLTIFQFKNPNNGHTRKTQNEKVYAFSLIDFRKAYDSVWHK